MSYINVHMWNLEKWYRTLYLQSINRSMDKENKYKDTKGESGGGKNWEVEIDTYTLLILCIKQISNENILYSTMDSKREGIYVYVWLIYFAMMVFPVVMYGCESWTVKKAER